MADIEMHRKQRDGVNEYAEKIIVTEKHKSRATMREKNCEIYGDKKQNRRLKEREHRRRQTEWEIREMEIVRQRVRECKRIQKEIDSESRRKQLKCAEYSAGWLSDCGREWESYNCQEWNVNIILALFTYPLCLSVCVCVCVRACVCVCVCMRMRLFVSGSVRFPQAPTPFPESS